MRLVTSVLGITEWTLRIPALAGAALYFAAVYRIARAVFGEGWTFLLAAAALSLNPFVLDFMVAARGYGLALALWMWALAILLEKPSRLSELAQAGAALALSVTANMVFVLPAAALAGMTLYSLRQIPLTEPAKKNKRTEAKPGLPPWVWFAAPIGGIAILFLLAAPIEEMKLDQFYTGVPTVSESLRSMATVSLLHSGPLAHVSWSSAWRDVVAFVIAPLALLGGLALGVGRSNRVLLFATVPAVFAGAALILIYFVMDRPYPADRPHRTLFPSACHAQPASPYA